jgi:hypothetical protein
MKKVKDSNHDYHAHKSISASGLKSIYKKSVYHYLNQKPFTSQSMNFGNAVHDVILEKKTKNIKVLPELNLRFKKDREERDIFMQKNIGDIILNQEEKKALDRVIKNFEEHDDARKLVNDLDEVENSYYGSIDGVDVRVRPDGVKYDSHIVDLKTTADGSPKAFRNQAYNLAYHLQACFYCEALGYDPRNFRYLTIENKYPYNIQIYSMSDNMIESGKYAWRSAFNLWKQYLKDGSMGGFIWDDVNDDGSLML